MPLKELVNISLYKRLSNGYSVLLFYCVLLFVLSTLGHVIDKKSGFTNGMIVGMIVSLYLWFNYGKRISNL
jgi:hypothetical protein